MQPVRQTHAANRKIPLDFETLTITMDLRLLGVEPE